jgi:hypothetical protein
MYITWEAPAETRMPLDDTVSVTLSRACTKPCWGNLRHDLRTQRDAGNPDEPKSLRKTCDAQRFSEGRDLLRIAVTHSTG